MIITQHRHDAGDLIVEDIVVMISSGTAVDVDGGSGVAKHSVGFSPCRIHLAL